jgi:uncharacterized membrane protein
MGPLVRILNGPRNALYAAVFFLVLVIVYAMFATHGLAANVALAFTLLGGCILGLVSFTYRIGQGERARHADHDH